MNIVVASIVGLSTWSSLAVSAVLPPQWPGPAPCVSNGLGLCTTFSPQGRLVTLQVDSSSITTSSDHATLCLGGEALPPAPTVGLYVPLTQIEGGPIKTEAAGASCLSLDHLNLNQPGPWRLTIQFGDDSAYFDLDVAAAP